MKEYDRRNRPQDTRCQLSVHWQFQRQKHHGQFFGGGGTICFPIKL